MVDGYNPVPVQYRKSAPVVASYSWIDIAAGTGMITFYGANATNLTDHFLTTGTPYSERVLTNEFAESETYVKEIDLDFDVEFNTPRQMRGQLIANVPFGVGYKDVSLACDSYIIVRVRHWDGSTETEIASATGKVFTSSGTALGQVMDCILVDVPLTLFKKGETLRITTELWAKRTPVNQCQVMLGHDPQNRAYGTWDQTGGGAARDFSFGTNPTTLKFEVPFVLDV